MKSLNTPNTHAQIHETTPNLSESDLVSQLSATEECVHVSAV